MLTPQEVSSKTFPKAVMGGYAMAAVDEFLDALTEDYGSLYKENAALKAKIKTLMEKMEEYRQVDDAMRSTLLAAQKMAKDIIAQAEQQRDAIAAEAESRKSSLVADAETVAKERIAELERQVAQAEERLADTKSRVAGEVAAQGRKLEKAREAVARFLQVSRVNCEEQLKILQKLEELEPEPIEVPAAPAQPPRESAPASAPEQEEEPPAPSAEAEEEPAGESGGEVQLDQDFFTTPLPTLEDIKKVQAKQSGMAGALEEDIAANVQAAMDELAVEERSVWDNLPEDATRVINLDDLQFGRNYQKEK